ncbi:DUF357 domain-containing protein [Nanoarchaeota archaeon]
MDTVTDEKLAKYFSVSQKAFDMAKGAVNPERQEDAEVVLDMVERYISDAHHFQDKGDKVTTFAALNYAHGWLDSAARLGIFTVKDSTLFTVDD